MSVDGPLYFAYGSNMLTERLQARVPSARPVGTATLPGHALRFRKQSTDGSAKCTVVSTSPSSCSRWPSPVVGVCFQMNDAHLPALDAAEGRGQGYTREKLDVDREGSCVPAFAYVAQDSHVNPDLHPYAWYKALVMAGARQHDLPPPTSTGSVPSTPFATPTRIGARRTSRSCGKPASPNGFSI